jgi:hypothetical protein
MDANILIKAAKARDGGHTFSDLFAAQLRAPPDLRKLPGVLRSVVDGGSVAAKLASKNTQAVDLVLEVLAFPGTSSCKECLLVLAVLLLGGCRCSASFYAEPGTALADLHAWVLLWRDDAAELAAVLSLPALAGVAWSKGDHKAVLSAYVAWHTLSVGACGVVLSCPCKVSRPTAEELDAYCRGGGGVCVKRVFGANRTTFTVLAAMQRNAKKQVPKHWLPRELVDLFLGFATFGSCLTVNTLSPAL